MTFFERIQADEKRRPGTIPKVFSTHPPTPERIENAQKEIARILPSRPEYIVTTSEFANVKERLRHLTLTKKANEGPSKPTLRTKTEQAGKKNPNPEGARRRPAGVEAPTRFSVMARLHFTRGMPETAAPCVVGQYERKSQGLVNEVLIAGGGLAGSAVAIHLGRLGISVELFERGSFPKEKPCGEGLMPAGVAALERLGLNTEKGAPFSGVRYHFGERIAKGRFPEAHGVLSSGRGFRRRDLDYALFELARQTPNVKVHTDATVEAPLIEGGRVVGLIVNGARNRGRLVIGADGAQSRLRHALKLDLPSRRKRIGVCAHFRLAPGRAMPQSVDVYLGPGYELYATPLPYGELSLSALASADAIQGRLEDQFRRWWKGQRHLAETLESAEQVSSMLAISPVSGRAKQRFLPGLVLLGDAAGFTDPIVGAGMTQALLAAELLGSYVAQNAGPAIDWLADFDREREKMVRKYRWLSAILRKRAFRLAALEGSRLFPWLFSHFLGVAAGTHRVWGLRSRCLPMQPVQCGM
jgi:menaquinone-9 beta-reductase